MQPIHPMWVSCNTSKGRNTSSDKQHKLGSMIIKKWCECRLSQTPRQAWATSFSTQWHLKTERKMHNIFIFQTFLAPWYVSILLSSYRSYDSSTPIQQGCHIVTAWTMNRTSNVKDFPTDPVQLTQVLHFSIFNQFHIFSIKINFAKLSFSNSLCSAHTLPFLIEFDPFILNLCKKLPLQ